MNIRNTRPKLWVTAVFAAGLAGCPSNSSAPASSKDSGADAAVDGGEEEDAVVYCPDGSIDSSTLVLGLPAKGKTMTAKLVSAMPQPPERYDNEWVVDFVDAAGSPIEDMTITQVAATMPFHAHPAKIGTVTPMSPGRFQLSLYLQMRGYFVIKVTVKSPMGTETLQYNYCLR